MKNFRNLFLTVCFTLSIIACTPTSIEDDFNTSENLNDDPVIINTDSDINNDTSNNYGDGDQGEGKDDRGDQ